MKTWVLEFVDLGGEMRRDVWYAFFSEVVAVHKFIREYGPEDNDESRFHVYGAHKGNERAMTNATNSIARLQALQFMRKLLDDPIKLVPFSFLQNAPYGDVVCQTLAVNIWGGPLVTNFLAEDNQVVQTARSSDEVYEGGHHVFDTDGSVYLRNWMKSPSWDTSTSISFWKNASVREGVILSKNLVVAGMSLVERAAETCKQRRQVAEKTQATIDSAMIKGIPSNIDLFKVVFQYYFSLSFSSFKVHSSDSFTKYIYFIYLNSAFILHSGDGKFTHPKFHSNNLSPVL